MVVFIFYEHLVREWEAINRLKTKLEKNNNRVFVFSILYERNKSYFCARKLKPDIVFMPWLTSVFFEKPAYYFVKKNPKVRIVDFHQEEVSGPDSFMYYMPKTTYGKEAAFHISWGQFFRDLLVKNGVKEDRVFITGNIRADLLIRTTITRDYLSKYYGLDNKKKWILFADSRGYFIQRTRKSEIVALIKAGTTLEEINECKEFEYNSLNSFVKDVNSLPNNFREKYEFIYRPHPGTDAPDSFPEWVKVISERSISDWIPNVDLFISCGSTTIFEAEIVGTPSILYDSYPRPSERGFFGIDEYPIIHSLNEVNDQLIDSWGNSNRRIYEKYVGKADGKSVDRVVQMIDVIMQNKYDSSVIEYASKMNKPTFYELFRHLVYEFLIWLLAKTALLEVLKWPNSAYVMRNDIPFYKKNSWIKSK